MRADFPFRPASLPFFYGWVILGASTLGVVMSVPGQTMGVSVFTDHLLAATGLSRLELSNAYLLGTLASGLMLPMGGTLVDRFGVRRTIVWASLGLAGTIAFLAQADRIATAVSTASSVISAPVASFALLTVGFAGIRFTGQGMLTLTSRTMVGRWFERRRGLVSAVSGPFVNFAFASAPLLLSLWIARAGWREAWLEMAVVVGCVMGGLGWLLFRESPEECGLRMDGDAPPPPPIPSRDGSFAAPVDSDFTRPEALRTGAFWLVVLAIGSQAMVGTGITFHIVNLGAEMGLSESEAVAIFLPVAMVTVPVGFLAGAAVDRFAVRRLIMVMMAAQAGMFGAVAYLGDPTLRIVAIVCWGTASGFYGPLTVAALPNFFGRAHLGAIQGAMMSCIVIASALGPSTLAVLRDVFDSYRPGLLITIALPVAVLLAAPFTRDPKRAVAKTSP